MCSKRTEQLIISTKLSISSIGYKYFDVRFNNIEAATEAKFALEQKQREEAKQRKEANESWRTKHFSLQGENWIYHTPLVNREKSAPS